METSQINSPQKTSFWDFWHKRLYLKKSEKIIDFSVGLILGIMILPLFTFIYLLPIFKGTSELLGLIIIYLPGILLIIHFAFKRKYLSLGILLGYVIMLFFVTFLISPAQNY